jgi:hypothetical protein
MLLTRPKICWTFAIGLKDGAQIKAGAMASRLEMEVFGSSVQARQIGRARAVTLAELHAARPD